LMLNAWNLVLDGQARRLPHGGRKEVCFRLLG
jgi:hypothetical protein